jgi:preprotein translocase subunit SecG
VETILLVILIVVAIAMIGLVLIQRSEGGALGIGGGGPGAMFSARGSANLLTRITAVLAAIFMILSLVLAVLSGSWAERDSVLDTVEEVPASNTLQGEPLALPGELDLDDAESLPLPEDDGPVVPRAQ